MYISEQEYFDLSAKIGNAENKNDIKKIISSYENANLICRELGDISLLITAMYTKQFEVVEVLLENGADCFAPNKNGITPLIYTTLLSPSYEICSAIGKYSTKKINTIENSLYPNLAQASYKILDEFNNVNVIDKKTYLHTASLNALKNIPKDELVKLINQINKAEKGLIIELACNNRFDHLQFLIDNGLNINKHFIDNETLLAMAIRINHTDLVDFLLKNSKNLLTMSSTIDPITNQAASPLYQAVSQGRIGIAIKLINAGADLDIQFNINSNINLSLLAYTITMLGLSAFSAENQNNFLKLLTAILEKRGSMAGWLTGYNGSPLQPILEPNNHHVLDVLLKNGIKSADDQFENFVVDLDGKFRRIQTTFLHILAMEPTCNNKLRALLAAKGQNINIDIKNELGFTPLEIACLQNNFMAVVVLLSHKANINLYNKEYDLTSLMMACRAGNLDIVKAMLRSQPQLLNHWTPNNSTCPLIAALYGKDGKGHVAVVEYLLSLNVEFEFLMEQYKKTNFYRPSFHCSDEIATLLIKKYIEKHGTKNLTSNISADMKKDLTKNDVQNKNNNTPKNRNNAKQNKGKNKNKSVAAPINQAAIPRLQEASANENVINPYQYLKDNFSPEQIKKFRELRAEAKSNNNLVSEENNNSEVINEQLKEKITWFNGRITAKTAGVTYIDSESCPNCYSFIATDSEELQGVDLTKFQEVANKFCPPAGGETGVKNISDWGLTVTPTIAGENMPLERMKNGKLTSEFDLEYEMKILGAEGRGNERLFGLSIQSDCGRYKLIYFSCHDANAHAKAAISAKYNNKAITLHLPVTKKNEQKEEEVKQATNDKTSDDNNLEISAASPVKKQNKKKAPACKDRFFKENKNNNNNNINSNNKKNNPKRK